MLDKIGIELDLVVHLVTDLRKGLEGIAVTLVHMLSSNIANHLEVTRKS